MTIEQIERRPTMRNRFVKVVRHEGPCENRPEYRYKPAELRNGNLYMLCNVDEGFDNPADAWKVIDAIERKERHPERCDCETCRPELYVTP